MANALVTSFYALTETEGVFEINGTAAITMGAAGHENVTWAAQSNNINPLLPNWRTRIANAVVAAAENITSEEIDNVIFPDFGVLGL